MIPSKLYPDAKVHGPYFNTEKGRYLVTVKWSIDDQTEMTYARFLMQEHLGRLLTDDEEVDHIDDNKKNDVITNLQILSQAENVAKSNKNRALTPEFEEAICFKCERKFQMDRKQQSSAKRLLKRNAFGPFCSRGCASNFARSQV